jgi:ABC-type nitrate/sulfonate/bicarbonate transport system substrate-binding protein
MTTARLPFLLNWYANPYHAPIFVAKELGYFEQEDINLAVLEPTDPSDVTELVGTGRADMGLKAMIHTIAGRVRGFPLKAIGMLLDEPPTGLLYYSNKVGAGSINGIQDLKGKRIGYIGEFGKYILDDLLRKNDVNPTDVHTVRVGMKVPDALAAGVIDAGIGLGNCQLIEVENTMLNDCGAAGFLKFDESLGIHCCFCSVLYIANERFLKEGSEQVQGFMRAIRMATDFTLQKPDQAFEVLCNALPRLRKDEETSRKIFHASLPYFCKGLATKEKDWNEVKEYMESLKLLLDASSFDIEQCYTNSWVPKETTTSI